MAFFKFSAFNAKTSDPIKVEVFLGGTSRGFAPTKKGEHLVAETSQSGAYSWYAKYSGNKIDSGSSSGDNIKIIYSP